VRVRFAPSPTGALHIGGARTAYFNWLFARQHGGQFILRIDDTDTARSTEASAERILDGMRWVGLDWDEGPDVGGPFGPYRQSQRYDLYKERLDALLEAGRAYPCFCTPEELAEDRRKAQEKGVAPRYGGRCRGLTPEDIRRRLADGAQPAYRLRIGELAEPVVVQDEIHGEVSFAAAELDDFIIWKSDGMPTYHFASCVDDALMRITHVIRAEEHLSNTARHVMLFRALGVPAPIFAHVPMILSQDRTKLSKRHGATSVQEFRDMGFLPEAILNGILLLGFSPGNEQEIVPRGEALKLFDLRRTSKHSAMYDLKKLEWLNGHYLRALPAADITDRLWSRLQAAGNMPAGGGRMSREDLAWVVDVVRANRERARNLVELADMASVYLQPVREYDGAGVAKHFRPDAADRLRRAADALDAIEPFLSTRVETVYRGLIAKWGVKGGDLIHPTRLALTGRTVGPGLFEIMQLLGAGECARRMRAAAEFIEKGNDGRAE
jgi:glutamyl-tRNA synthetase